MLTQNGCDKPCIDPGEEITISFSANDYELNTKAEDPHEGHISDINLLIFDENGDLEESIWTPYAESIEINLRTGRRYSFRACANFGYMIQAMNIQQMDEYVYHMTYPDEYHEGIPMAGSLDNVMISSRTEIRITLLRLMAKISLRLDRSGLSDGVDMQVRSVRIGNCPKSIKIFGENKVAEEEDCFNVGFRRDEYETSILNYQDHEKTSGELTLYMLENMQGEYGENLTNDNDKVFDEYDMRAKTCSYIEMELEYLSDSKYSKDDYLKYRFYLGEDLGNLDIERNCHYHITVCPEDDGLNHDGWRVDKSGISDIEATSFQAYPSRYIRGNIGDTIHIWCEFTPSSAPFDVGINYMKEDKNQGIYDFQIDSDGHGATLTLTGPGTGLIYMEAGAPVNAAALFIIEVNL